jgi:hypothetical protein
MSNAKAVPRYIYQIAFLYRQALFYAMVTEKCCTNQTPNSHLKQCISLGFGD